MEEKPYSRNQIKQQNTIEIIYNVKWWTNDINNLISSLIPIFDKDTKLYLKRYEE